MKTNVTKILVFRNIHVQYIQASICRKYVYVLNGNGFVLEDIKFRSHEEKQGMSDYYHIGRR